MPRRIWTPYLDARPPTREEAILANQKADLEDFIQGLIDPETQRYSLEPKHVFFSGGRSVLEGSVTEKGILSYLVFPGIDFYVETEPIDGHGPFLNIYINSQAYKQIADELANRIPEIFDIKEIRTYEQNRRHFVDDLFLQ